MSARVAGVVSVRGAAVAALIPALAVAAHAIASGSAPGPSGVAAALLVGVVAGVFAGPHCGRFGLLLILSAGQAAAHLALSLGMTHSAAMVSGMSAPTASPAHHVMPSGEMMGGSGHAAHDSTGGASSMLLDHLAVLAHPGSADGLLMLLTHLVAIPLCVVLVALAGAVSGMATVVVAVLTRPITAIVHGVSTVVTVTPLVVARRIDRAAGAGTRGPPVVGICV